VRPRARPGRRGAGGLQAHLDGRGVRVGCFPDLYDALTGNPPDQVITL
jgi:hypothetical protein